MPALEFSLAAATLVSIVVESVLYGFSVFMFGATLWLLVRGRPSGAERVNWGMCAAVALLFALGTMHIVLDARDAYVAFVDPAHPPHDAFDGARVTAKNAVHECEILLADAVLIYRCYATWRSVWVVVPCVAGWLAVFVTGTLSVWTMSLPQNGPSDFFDRANTEWYIAYTTLAVITNVASTCLLAYKLWAVDRATARHRRTRSVLQPVMRIVLECGAVYSLALLVSVATYHARSNATYVLVDIIGQIIPITFYVIILCASMAQVALFSPAERPLSQACAAPAAAERPALPVGRTLVSPVEVHITQYVDSDYDEAASLASPGGSEKAV